MWTYSSFNQVEQPTGKWSRTSINISHTKLPVKSVRLLSESKIFQEATQTSTSTMDKIHYLTKKSSPSRAPLSQARFSSWTLATNTLSATKFPQWMRLTLSECMAKKPALSRSQLPRMKTGSSNSKTRWEIAKMLTRQYSTNGTTSKVRTKEMISE
jgi:hypothetical protein